MPQRLAAVKDLQTISLVSFSKYLLNVTSYIENDPERSRRYFINNVDGSTRTRILECTRKLDEEKKNQKSLQLLDLVTCQFEFSRWLCLLSAMLDNDVKSLPHLHIHDSMLKELMKLSKILNPFNLQNLSLTYYLQEYTKDMFPIQRYVSLQSTIQQSLKDSLASKLSVLELQYVCNNAILKAIGENSVHLRHLNIRDSSDVDITGIINLLFDERANLPTNMISEDECCRTLNKLCADEILLNACCFSLEEFMIEEIILPRNALLMILSCVKGLKRVAKYNYIFELSDALLTIWKNSTKPKIFHLDTLEDIEMTAHKLSIFGHCLPFVKHFIFPLYYDFGTHDLKDLERKSIFWNRIEYLRVRCIEDTIFDLGLFDFIKCYGHNLRQLIIEDNEMDDECNLDAILKNCPNLDTLKGPLHIVNQIDQQFIKLKKINITYPNVETIIWLFNNCPNLDDLTLYCYEDLLNMRRILIDMPLVNMCNNIKRLKIVFRNRIFVTGESAAQLIDKCPNLEELGPLTTWNIDRDITNEVEAHIKRMNYNLKLKKIYSSN